MAVSFPGSPRPGSSPGIAMILVLFLAWRYFYALRYPPSLPLTRQELHDVLEELASKPSSEQTLIEPAFQPGRDLPQPAGPEPHQATPLPGPGAPEPDSPPAGLGVPGPGQPGGELLPPGASASATTLGSGL